MAGTGIELIIPDWPAPPGIVAVSTTRVGGTSTGCYESLNLATHVGDLPAAVDNNRALLIDHLSLIVKPRWLNQVHGTQVVEAEKITRPVAADAAVASAPDIACVVMTADCLPILLCDRQGRHVAAVHGGWRGLASGVIATAVSALLSCGVDPADLIAWLGPAIGPAAYEVGEDVRDAVRATDASRALTPGVAGRWQLDLYRFARCALRACGVESIHGGDFCTYSDSQRFFSYRRDGTCGRQATLIWRSSAPSEH
jgi:YfiH family protein